MWYVNALSTLALMAIEFIQEHRRIIFVVHSLGGLVTERALQGSETNAEKHLRQIEDAALGIVFLGTPHAGSDLAPFAKAVGKLLSLAGKRVNTTGYAEKRLANASRCRRMVWSMASTARGEPEAHANHLLLRGIWITRCWEVCR
jgi:hypothetical protein